jgi:hypothetical protein
MSRPAFPALRRVPARVGAVLLAAVLATGTVAVLTGSGDPATGAVQVSSARAKAANIVTPGNFTGLGFDQCQAPSQAKMDRWLESSPFLAVGIYIDGDSRACRKQTYLNATWVRTQLEKGWRLLPITLGPQASCQPRFPRYQDDFKISPKVNAAGVYAKALKQGKDQAARSVAAAGAYGISPGSTLWYDLEGFDHKNTRCRESALTFLSGWTQQIRAQGYVSGVYSSAGSGILALDNARVNRPGVYTMPDRIWIARWDGKANTSTSYLRPDGWMPHRRVKQYQGGHNETWGGVTINIDRNFLDLGRGSRPVAEKHCGGVPLSFSRYDVIRPTTPLPPPTAQVKALQCLLQERGLYTRKLHGRYTARTQAAANAWQSSHGLLVRPAWTRRAWVSLLADGPTPVVKFGSANTAVRRLQRAVNAAAPGKAVPPIPVSGVFDAATVQALRAWQAKVGVEVSGVAGSQTWAALLAGQR